MRQEPAIPSFLFFSETGARSILAFINFPPIFLSFLFCVSFSFSFFGHSIRFPSLLLFFTSPERPVASVWKNISVYAYLEYVYRVDNDHLWVSKGSGRQPINRSINRLIKFTPPPHLVATEGEPGRG